MDVLFKTYHLNFKYICSMKAINKKATSGMLVAMVMSLGVMQGINSEKTNDFNLQQASLVCAYAAGAGEIGDEVYTDEQRGVL
ncbi:MAG: hypothetical protein LBG28_11720 [Tannerella sp.]|jgi:hypothetical protein|nr:hypothetical protein [Tannerella sp.]